ncbi:MAG: hypothetical protein ACW99Q_28665, partial [Candidatus Kariarchaeaceae archaeon]
MNNQVFSFRFRVLFRYSIIILLLVPIPFTHAQGNPIIDGLISSGEWDQSEKFNFRMTNGVDITLKIIYTETDIYFLATFPHNSPGDVIVREPWINNEAVQHDY